MIRRGLSLVAAGIVLAGGGMATASTVASGSAPAGATITVTVSQETTVSVPKPKPPPPLSSQALASIQAAAHPANVPYLYYVRIPGTDRHAFFVSPTAYDQYLATHNYGPHS